jgi:hypothetical protein
MLVKRAVVEVLRRTGAQVEELTEIIGLRRSTRRGACSVCLRQAARPRPVPYEAAHSGGNLTANSNRSRRLV